MGSDYNQSFHSKWSKIERNAAVTEKITNLRIYVWKGKKTVDQKLGDQKEGLDKLKISNGYRTI